MIGNPGDIAGEILEQGGTIAKQTVKVGKNIPADFVKAAVQQVGSTNTASFQSASKNNEQVQSKPEDQKAQGDTDTKDFIQSLYGKSHKEGQKSTINPDQNVSQKYPGKTTEEINKLIALRQQMHTQTYFDPTFNRVIKKEEPVTERLEREEEQETMKEFEDDKKKPAP